ncbi:MAG: UspA domain protein, partial [Chloroflexi bacterium]
MTRTVVVPLIGPQLDPEGVAETALPVALALARRTQASVLLVSVLELLVEATATGERRVLHAADALPASKSLQALREHTEQLIADRQAYLERVAASIADLPVTTQLQYGDPSAALLEQAAGLEAPVIVMASHARTGARRMLLGSVAFRVVRDAPCPVLIVPAQAAVAAPSTEPLLERVLVPLDGSALAEAALDTTLEVLGERYLDLHLVSVVEPLVRRSGWGAQEYDALARQFASEYLTGVAARLAERGLRVSWEIRAGSPERQIAEVARERRVDLIAMATHGRSGFGRYLFGSVAEGLAAVGTPPLLLVRPSPESLAARSSGASAANVASAGDASPPEVRRVSEVMSQPVISVERDATLDDVARLMLQHDIGCVPVVDADGRLVGIITESDFIGKGHGVPFAAYRSPQLFSQVSATEIERLYATGRSISAWQVMQRPVVTATEDEPVSIVAQRMLQHNVHRIPVVRAGVPVGIVTRRDLLKLIVPDG